ncbi:glycoside hydrolase domain-containing protein [Mesorhizobium sp. WSM4887]|uniref:glycoside hydrolase domain-containing protein n=1 Tax=Mesorhizobium sp. WSM4887 TaxID=3038543 RepID=UPI0024177789|nr:glycoside hydrolase domain-containing protein [Mesorhizobium sp. WSM4887]MDG4889729.1 DUF1906 domain-containing protein [Mesorhizobium sp. WSM4887]
MTQSSSRKIKERFAWPTRFLWVAFVATLVLMPASAPAASYCRLSGQHTAADLSGPVSDKLLKKMKAIDVQTIIRYFDYPDETIKGKTLTPPERRRIAEGGFDLLVVFQHHNNRFSSFTAQRGHDDAVRSMALAKANNQPSGSAVYFGVDGPWGSDPSELAAITRYFTAARKVLDAANFRLGVYGSGLVCRRLTEKSLVDLCWLANAKSWPEFRRAEQSGKWALLQTLPEDCGGINVDFDIIGASPDYGQFH